MKIQRAKISLETWGGDWASTSIYRKAIHDLHIRQDFTDNKQEVCIFVNNKMVFKHDYRMTDDYMTPNHIQTALNKSPDAPNRLQTEEPQHESL